nr:MAG TPA: gamma Translocon-associated protein, gamma subunit (TRAP-gamma) [Caudoviricetes sp.]
MLAGFYAAVPLWLFQRALQMSQDNACRLSISAFSTST